MIQYDATHPNRTGRKDEGLKFAPRTITTLDSGTVTLLGGDSSSRIDPETLQWYRPAQKRISTFEMGDNKISVLGKERSSR